MKPHPIIPILIGYALLFGTDVFVSSTEVFFVLCIMILALAWWGMHLVDLQCGKRKFFDIRITDLGSVLINVFGFFLLLTVVFVALDGPVRPQFEEQERQMKIAHALSDMHGIEMAVEKYNADHRAYPSALVPNLTTPVAYTEKVPEFFSKPPVPYRYFSANGNYIIASPRQTGKGALDWDAMSTETLQHLVVDKNYRATLMYDGTNGSNSAGSLFRLSSDSFTRR